MFRDNFGMTKMNNPCLFSSVVQFLGLQAMLLACVINIKLYFVINPHTLTLTHTTFTHTHAYTWGKVCRLSKSGSENAKGRVRKMPLAGVVLFFLSFGWKKKCNSCKMQRWGEEGRGPDSEQTHYKIYTRSKRTFNPLTPPQKAASVPSSASGCCWA